MNDAIRAYMFFRVQHQMNPIDACCDAAYWCHIKASDLAAAIIESNADPIANERLALL